MGIFDDDNPKKMTPVDWVITGLLVFFILYMIWQVVRAGRFW